MDLHGMILTGGVGGWGGPAVGGLFPFFLPEKDRKLYQNKGVRIKKDKGLQTIYYIYFILT